MGVRITIDPFQVAYVHLNSPNWSNEHQKICLWIGCFLRIFHATHCCTSKAAPETPSSPSSTTLPTTSSDITEVEIFLGRVLVGIHHDRNPYPKYGIYHLASSGGERIQGLITIIFDFFCANCRGRFGKFCETLDGILLRFFLFPQEFHPNDKGTKKRLRGLWVSSPLQIIFREWDVEFVFTHDMFVVET